MLDLFTLAEQRYPKKPGFKTVGTSSEAAAKVTSKAATLRQRCLQVLEEAGPFGLTSDEVAAKLGETPFACRPRLTELRKLNLAKPNGLRRKNDSGLAADVLVAP